MINSRYTAILATISNSFCDAVLDYAVNKFNLYKTLFLSALIASLFQSGLGLLTSITISASSLPYILLHAVFVLAGYICFALSLKYLPLGLVGLLEAGNLFLTFIIDSYLGYIHITSYFIINFLLFIFSVFLFVGNVITPANNTPKKINTIGFFWILASILFYVVSPYLVKIANSNGANEIAINLGYYILAIPYFYWQYLRTSRQNASPATYYRHWWNNLYLLSLIIGLLEGVYYIFETVSFVHDAPTIVMIIEQMRIFLIFLLSVWFKMDKFSFRKVIALVLGIISVTGICFS